MLDLSKYRHVTDAETIINDIERRHFAPCHATKLLIQTINRDNALNVLNEIQRRLGERYRNSVIRDCIDFDLSAHVPPIQDVDGIDGCLSYIEDGVLTEAFESGVKAVKDLIASRVLQAPGSFE